MVADPLPVCALHSAPAGISTTPSISSISGDTSGATLRVMRPGTMADDAVASYVIQAYTDAEASTKVGHALIRGPGHRLHMR